MRILATLWLAGCGATPLQPAPALSPTSTSFSGTVTDERGAPIADAEVLLCDANGPCDYVRQHAESSARHLVDLVAEYNALATVDDHRAEGVVATATDSNGRWRIEVPVYRGARLVSAVIAAPGHWTGGVGGSAPLAAADLARIELGAAFAIDLTPHCTPAPCPAHLHPAVRKDGHAKGRYVEGTHLDRLALGTYTIELTAGYHQPGEQRGSVVVSADTPSSVAVDIQLAPTGTGQAIAGTITGGSAGDTIYAQCGDVSRSARIGDGAFRIEDVGTPPCRLELLGGPDETIKLGGDTTIAALPATVHLLVERSHVECRD